MSDSTPAGVDPDLDLAAARADFERDGFIAIDRITTDEELARLARVYDELLAGKHSGYLDGVFDLARPYGTRESPRLGQLLLPERYVDDFSGTTVCRNARRIVAALLEVDEERLEVWSHLIFKAPHNDTETPWHQDEAYWDVHLSYQSVATWLPLDDVDEENGCLWYVPGSHRGPIHRHRHLGGDPSVHVLEVDEPVDTTGAVPVPLSAGGLVMHHPRSLHYAGPNRTPALRRAWGIVFQTAPVPRDKPLDHPWWHAGRQAHQDSLNKRDSGR